MKTRIEFGIATHVGMVRSENQDSCTHLVVEAGRSEERLFVVADGMGGQRSGKLASDMAVRRVAARFREEAGSDIGARLGAAFRDANEAVFTYGSTHEESRGMGTTCVALAIRERRAWIAHIGDSRVYRIARTGIEQLTADHTTVAEMQRRGLLTEDEAATHPARHQLYRALGVRAEMEADRIDDIAIGVKESFLLCTDGLYEYVTDDDMRETVQSCPPQEACDRMIMMANARGGSDNSTVCVVRVQITTSVLEHMRWEQ